MEFEGSKMLKMDRGQAVRLYECHKGKKNNKELVFTKISIEN